MNITFIKTLSEKNALKKTWAIADSLTLATVTLKAPTNLKTPVLNISLARFTSDVSVLLSYNYVYIPDFGRYYFIDSISFPNKDIASISLTEDVLMSFRSVILANTGFVLRSSLGTTMLPDKMMQFTDDWDISIVTPSSGTLVDTSFDPSMTGSKKNIVVTCIAKDTSVITGTGDTSFIASSPQTQGLPSVNMYRMDVDRFSFNYIFDKSTFEVFSNAIFGSAEYYSFIKNVMVFPFEPPRYKPGGADTPVSVVLGENSLGFSTNLTSTKSLSPYLVAGDFTIPSSSYFYDYEPYTKIDIYVPYCGFVEVSPSQVRGCNLIVYYQVNYADGSASAQIFNKTKDCLVWQGTCQLGLSVALSYSNEQEIADKRTSSTLNAILGGFSSAIAGIGAAAAGHPVAGVVGAAMGISKSIAGKVENELTNYQRGSVGCISGANGLFMPQSIVIRYARKKAFDGNSVTLTRINAEYNKADAQVRVLSTLENTGYAEVDGINFVYTATSPKPTLEETNEIETLLKTGVIF